MIQSRNWDDEERKQDIIDDDINNDYFLDYNRHIQKKLKTPEYRRIMIGLNLLIRSLASMQNTWRRTKRELLLIELTNNMYRQHDIEIEIDKIGDSILREYIYGQLDDISTIRRSISEEIKWDMETNKNLIK